MSSFTVSYCPESNKIRLYVGHVPRSEYEALRAAGFTSTPKQDCDFVATWSPQREDLAMDYLEDGEDIGDEDYSPLERSADRAERFGDYRDRRAGEAGASAGTFEAGPSAFGHQNARRAERQASRHDRHRRRACSQWGKAEYWQQRTESVIRHALHKSSAHVRRGRILVLEAEQRKNAKSIEEYAKRFKHWQMVLTLDGQDYTYKPCDLDAQATHPKAFRLAYALANSIGCLSEFQHPRTGEKKSLYSLLTDAADPITPREAATLWLADRTPPGDPDSNMERWARHYELRLGYERAMLAEEGGTAADAEMEPGGWIRGGRTNSCLTDTEGGWKQIQSVTRSPVTKKVTSVKVWGVTRGYTPESNYKEYGTKPCLVSVNVERMGEDNYRAPTPEEKEAFLLAQKEQKKATKASKPKPIPIINPTDEDAQKLQDLWNRKAAEEHAEAKKDRRVYSDFEPAEVLRLTQAQYSANSKGSYARLETRALHACGRLARRFTGMHSGEGKRYDRSLGKHVATVRIDPSYDKPDQVIVLIDKPQKPLPLDWQAVEAGTVQPAEAQEQKQEEVVSVE